MTAERNADDATSTHPGEPCRWVVDEVFLDDRAELVEVCADGCGAVAYVPSDNGSRPPLEPWVPD